MNSYLSWKDPDAGKNLKAEGEEHETGHNDYGNHQSMGHES